MNKAVLKEIALKLVAPKKGILAADWSLSSSEKHFGKNGIEHTLENRRKYRQMLFTVDGLEKYISGVIFFEETLKQRTDQGETFPRYLNEKGIIPGIKVDKGAYDMSNFTGEKLTRGLDDLSERLEEYKHFGARFTKWRAVITIGDSIPSLECLEANAQRLAEYAATSQEFDLVPIVEPEVLMEGNHSIEESMETTKKTLLTLFGYLEKYNVYLPGVILKTNFVHPGKDFGEVNDKEVAQKTLQVLERVLPPHLPGVVFLSGGDSSEEATAHLNDANKLKPKDFSWPLTFSYARAIQYPAISIWQGKEENVTKAQKAIIKRAKLNSLASEGKYAKEMEMK